MIFIIPSMVQFFFQNSNGKVSLVTKKVTEMNSVRFTLSPIPFLSPKQFFPYFFTSGTQCILGKMEDIQDNCRMQIFALTAQIFASFLKCKIFKIIVECKYLHQSCSQLHPCENVRYARQLQSADIYINRAGYCILVKM